MKSNSFFSFNRFGLLLKNDMLLNYKQYLLTIVVAFIAGYIVIYTHLPDREYIDDYTMQRFNHAFTYCLMGFGAFVGLSFPALSSKAGTQAYLMMPNSTFEKYLSQFLIRIVIATFLFFVIFRIDAYLASATMVYKLKASGEPFEIIHFSYLEIFRSMNTEIIMRIVLLIFIVCIGFYLFSVRLFFRKQAIFKTVISFFVLFFTIFILMLLTSKLFYPESIALKFKLTVYHVYENIINMEMWMMFMYSFSWIFLLPLGYFKLKEKQL